MTQVTPSLFHSPPPGYCKGCGRPAASGAGGWCAFCVKRGGIATPAQPAALPLSVRHAPSESFTAAARVASKVTGMHALIVDLIRERGKMTCREVEEVTGLKHQTASARLYDLEGKNRRYRGPVLLYRTGERKDGSGYYDLIERSVARRAL